MMYRPVYYFVVNNGVDVVDYQVVVGTSQRLVPAHYEAIPVMIPTGSLKF